MAQAGRSTGWELVIGWVGQPRYQVCASSQQAGTAHPCVSTHRHITHTHALALNLKQQLSPGLPNRAVCARLLRVGGGLRSAGKHPIEERVLG